MIHSDYAKHQTPRIPLFEYNSSKLVKFDPSSLSRLNLYAKQTYKRIIIYEKDFRKDILRIVVLKTGPKAHPFFSTEFLNERFAQTALSTIPVE